MRRLLIFTILLLLAGCALPGNGSTPTPARPTEVPTPVDPGVLAEADQAALRDKVPLLAEREEAFAQAAEKSIPVLELRQGLDDQQRAAQDIALQTPAFTQLTRDPRSGAPLRSEIFGVYPLRASDITDATASCRQATCYRVELYNYALNSTTTAVVDMGLRQTISVSNVQDTQPDIPPELAQLATQIAINSPAVVSELGGTPDASQATMANIKTSLSKTTCERSKHLCVAPTFLQRDRALWAIVDLTDGRLVGARWTDLGTFDGPRVTEKSLQNEAVSRAFCEQETQLERDGWSMRYMLTSSDGLKIADVQFQGRPVLRSAKLVDWHVNYSQLQGFGYSDAVGCPVFSQAAVIAIGPPEVAELRENDQPAGFTLTQHYWSEFWPQPCNYNYEQVYEFYADGRFRVKAASLGRGCGDDGMYRPVFRVALAGPQTVAQWDGAAWQTWPEERWALQKDVPTTTEGYQYRSTAEDGRGYYLEPSAGQFSDGGRGDNAYVYVTRQHADRDEGEADLVTIGPCCNEDERQGPEKFIEPSPEPIAGAEVVIWYVPQLKNDDTPGQEYCWANQVLENGIYVNKVYPCFGGPLFVPTS
jgi:hypothetical protein